MDDNGHDGSADSGRTGDGVPHPGFLHPHPKGWTGPHPHTPVENRDLFAAAGLPPLRMLVDDRVLLDRWPGWGKVVGFDAVIERASVTGVAHCEFRDGALRVLDVEVLP